MNLKIAFFSLNKMFVRCPILVVLFIISVTINPLYAQDWAKSNIKDLQRVDLRDLGYPDVSTIPSNSSAITSLLTASTGKIYGATSGESFIRGKAGERFCVRNSGADVVVEGVGDHGCEYMTGGNAIILGETGRNFAAGMSGGIAYVYDVKHHFDALCNKEMVDLDPVMEEDEKFLHEMIEKQFTLTGSTVAKFILNDFENQLKNFVKVFPKDYKKVLAERKSHEVLELTQMKNV